MSGSRRGFRPARRAGCVVLLASIPLLLPRPAGASDLVLANTAMIAAFAALGDQVCFAYTYDRNGNRLSTNNVTYSRGGTWGSSAYGCFNWASASSLRLPRGKPVSAKARLMLALERARHNSDTHTED